MPNYMAWIDSCRKLKVHKDDDQHSYKILMTNVQDRHPEILLAHPVLLPAKNIQQATRIFKNNFISLGYLESDDITKLELAREKGITVPFWLTPEEVRNLTPLLGRFSRLRL